MVKILFLDLDGTVRESQSGATFINNPHDQKLIDGVEQAIARYPDYYVIGITNQGGVAAGKKSLQDCIEEQKQTLRLLPRMNDLYFCPDFDGNICYHIGSLDSAIQRYGRIDFACDYLAQWQGLCRKPNAGMVEIAIAEMVTKVDRNSCLFVGDRPEDEQCAKNAGIPFMWANEWRQA